ncbi:hypothetical protein RYX36_005550 [Vicia faba]
MQRFSSHPTSSFNFSFPFDFINPTFHSHSIQLLLKPDKQVLLTLIGSLVEASETSDHVSLKNLIPCLVELLSNREWVVKKAAAETLVVLANIERDFLSEFKSDYLKVFENGKVKLVREVMTQMLEAWKHIPDTPPPKSQSSSKGSIKFWYIMFD